jgi:hypothetical protein
LALKQFYIKNVGPAKIQRVQQKIPGCWTYVQQNENKFQKVCDMAYKDLIMKIEKRFGFRKLPETVQVQFNNARQTPEELLED